MAGSLLHGHKLFIAHVVNIWVVGVIRHLFTLFKCRLKQALFFKLRLILRLTHRVLEHLALSGACLHVTHYHSHLNLSDDIGARISLLPTAGPLSAIRAIFVITTASDLFEPVNFLLEVQIFIPKFDFLSEQPSPKGESVAYGFAPYWLLNKASEDYSKSINNYVYFALELSPNGSIKKLTSPTQEEPGWTTFQRHTAWALVVNARVMKL